MIFSESCVSEAGWQCSVRMPGQGCSPLPWSPCLTLLCLCRQLILSRDCETGNCRDYQETLHTLWSCRPRTRKICLMPRLGNICIVHPLEMQYLSVSIICSLKFPKFRRLGKIHVWFLSLSAILKPFECCVRKTPSSLYNVNDQVGER